MKYRLGSLFLLVAIVSVVALFYSVWWKQKTRLEQLRERVCSASPNLSRDEFIKWVGLTSEDSTKIGFEIVDRQFSFEDPRTNKRCQVPFWRNR